MLPKLRKVNLNRTKKKIFLLTDDIMSPSGVGTMARELVLGTVDQFDWVQLAAGLDDKQHGQVVDMSEHIEKELGKQDVYVKQYKHKGYFSFDAFFQIMELERPDCVMLFTDPRHFMEFWPHEHTIRSEYKIPIIYNSIWDTELVPLWNEPFYRSCDLLLAINKQTHLIHQTLLKNYIDLDKDEVVSPTTQPLIKYLPHGINSEIFKPIEYDPNYDKFVEDFKKRNDVDFVIFWNSRNIRRKQPGDIILAFKKFCDMLTPEQAKRVCLLMKTHVQDHNGTDLMAVKDAICPNYKVIFNQEHLPPAVLNYFYNLADVTVNFSSAEGFGLGIAESIMAGTMVIAPVHGGLQDQMCFRDESGNVFFNNEKVPSNVTKTYTNHGAWVLPMWPTAKQLQGSVYTPYLYDYCCDATDLADQMLIVHNMPKEERIERGQLGREWMLSDESKMSHTNMCNGFVEATTTLLNHWTPKPKYSIQKVVKSKQVETVGIL